MKLKDKIKYLRELKGVTVNKLANQAGISQSYLREIELGNKNPTIETLSHICHALDISLKDFFDDDALTSFKDDESLKVLYKLTPEQRTLLTEFLKSL